MRVQEETKGVSLRRLICEKIPFLLPVLLACYMAVSSRFGDDAFVINEQVPFLTRFGNSFVFVCTYIKRTLIPWNLTFFYPYPLEGIPIVKMIAGFFVLLFASILAFKKRKESPAFFVGWFYFLFALIPIIGLLHIGSSSTADRYTYFPHVGFLIMLIWGVYTLWVSRAQME